MSVIGFVCHEKLQQTAAYTRAAIASLQAGQRVERTCAFGGVSGQWVASIDGYRVSERHHPRVPTVELVRNRGQRRVLSWA